MFIVSPTDQNDNRKATTLQPDNVHETMAKDFKYPVVETVLSEDMVLQNPNTMLPASIKIFPEHLTIFTEEQEYRRRGRGNLPMERKSLAPSEAAFYVYAYNEAGQLLRPLTTITYQGRQRLVCPYDIRVFTQYINGRRYALPYGVAEIPVHAARDFEGSYAEDYNPSYPQSNPLHAVMVKGISPGRYAFSVHVTSIGKDAQITDVSASCAVEVIEGFEKVNGLGLISSPGRLVVDSADSRKAGIGLTVGESIEVRAVGVKARQRWDETTLDYKPDTPMHVVFKELGWTFLPNSAEASSAFFIESLNSSGTTVRITCLKDLPGKEAGELRVYGMGKVWKIDLRCR